jgi:hypothetical protein
LHDEWNGVGVKPMMAQPEKNQESKFLFPFMEIVAGSHLY